MTIYTPSQADKKPDKDIAEPEVVTEPLTGVKDKEAAAVVVADVGVNYYRAKRRSAFMYTLLAIIVMAMLALGAIGSVVLYRHLNKKVYEGRCGNVFFDAAYHDGLEGPNDAAIEDYVDEDFVVNPEEKYENAHTPKFDEVRESFVFHDFMVNYTAIIDHELEKCYVTALKKSIVRPDDLVLRIETVTPFGVKLQTVVIRENYIVRPPTTTMLFGKRIFNLCVDYDMYWLEVYVNGVVKRSVDQLGMKPDREDKPIATYGMFTNNGTHQELYKLRLHVPPQLPISGHEM